MRKADVIFLLVPLVAFQEFFPVDNGEKRIGKEKQNARYSG
jgi:hypothetical protein